MLYHKINFVRTFCSCYKTINTRRLKVLGTETNSKTCKRVNLSVHFNRNVAACND